MPEKVNRAVDFLEKICLAGSSCAMLLIMFVTTVDLLARKLIDCSIPTLYELTEDYWMVTPPVGMNACVVSATTKISLDVVFRGTAVLLTMDCITLTLLLAFPSLSTYLPSKMMA